MTVQTFTFYSYKGGTGRSLLLANTARYLAHSGYRVVALDFDFEAPGLHYKLNISPPGQRAGSTTPKLGAVDYLLATTEGEAPPSSLRKYVVPVHLPKGIGGSLHLIPAGAAPSGDYWRALTTLLHHGPFSDRDGTSIAACLELKARIEEELSADYLLIDSRTGVTELAGVSTSVLADKVVCLMLANRESQAGARAVLRSLNHATRLVGDSPIKVIPVISRVPEQDTGLARETLQYLNEKNGTHKGSLSFKKVFFLRADPELGRAEKLYVGSGEGKQRSVLHQDYLALLTELTETDARKASRAARRLEAIRDTRAWLTDDWERNRHRRIAPDGFRDAQVDEGVVVNGVLRGKRETRYADLVAYAGEDRTEVLLVVEYVEDLDKSDAWRWWQDFTRLRCAVLIAKNEGKQTARRVFTRGRRGQDFVERDDFSGWAVRWPISFSTLDDPGDRSVASLLSSVQRGEDGFISLLVQEWQRASFVTLHGGAPYRPALARQILDGLAQAGDVETEVRILWRTSPDPFERSYEGMKMGLGIGLEEMTTRELHAPLWWRLSLEAKLRYWKDRWHGGTNAGIELLGQELMGLSFDQDREFRTAVGSLLGPFDEDDESNRGAYRFSGLFQARELEIELSDDTPPELIRRAALQEQISGVSENQEKQPWRRAESEARNALRNDRALSALLRVPGEQLSLPTTNLLARYDPEIARLKVYGKVIDGCARLLNLDRRLLANVAFLHEMVHVLCHLGKDLDGRRWEGFGLPTSRDPIFRPSPVHETLAQFFSHRLLTKLGDRGLLRVFEDLSDHQPPEYQAWRKMINMPIEQVRAMLLRARTGLGDFPS